MAESELVAAVRQLQAETIAQALVLRSLISSHPNRALLSERWAGFYAGAQTDALLSKNSEPHRATVHQAFEDAVREWSGYLDEDPEV